ncbi:hypothetical protein [uncultured Sphingomonas sp.]|uniref:hypothetical protein n=1 Tax=uncultured Sphingomonas sp. TaxID=158754 RepID=UPI0025D33BAA|nr:hypothetical protein [uncultured Sphingomonas sp.]
MPADRAMLAQLTARGMTEDEAHVAFDHVAAAARAVLMTGKSVTLPDIGRLVSTKLKPAWVPGYARTKARQERKVAFRYPAFLEQGEPYDVR